MESSTNTFSVKEAADMLGISEFTVRRRIQNGQLTAVIDSKKQGYRITKDSIMDYAKSQYSKIGSIWKKTTAAATTMSSFFFPVPILGAIAGNFSTSKQNQSKFDLNSIDDPTIIDKIIERLNVDLDEQDLQIRHLQFNISHITDDSKKSNEQEKLFTLESKKLQIKREIKDLELHKTILESSKHDLSSI